jgi:hypothetical protein
MLAELAAALEREGIEPRPAGVHAWVEEMLRRDKLTRRVRVDRTLDAATAGALWVSR